MITRENYWAILHYFFSYQVFEIWYEFYKDRAFQCGLDTVQVLRRHTGLRATISNIAALESSGPISPRGAGPTRSQAAEGRVVTHAWPSTVVHTHSHALVSYCTVRLLRTPRGPDTGRQVSQGKNHRNEAYQPTRSIITVKLLKIKSQCILLSAT